MPQTQSGEAPAAIEKADPTLRRRLIGGLVVIGLYFAVQLIPRPVAIKPEGWRLLGIFAATIGGLVFQPLAGGALGLIAVTLASGFGSLSLPPTLEGDPDPPVGLGVSALFLFNPLFKNRLAPRNGL